MSITNDIRMLIDIQDSNVIFEQDFFQMSTVKGKNCKFIKGKLSYMPAALKIKTILSIKTGHKLHVLRSPSSGCIQLIYC